MRDVFIVNQASNEKLTIYLQNYSIGIFTHLKLCLSDAIHNFKWVKIIQIWQNEGDLYSNLADLCHIIFKNVLLDVAIKKWKSEYIRGRRLKGYYVSTETSPMVNKSGFQYSSSSSTGGTRSGQQYNTMPHHGGVPQETAVVPEQSLGVHATMPHRRVGSPPVHQQPVVESPVLALKRGGQQVGYHMKRLCSFSASLFVFRTRKFDG